MRVAVLGGGSWGTTVASLVAKRNDVLLWARNREVVDEINESHTNSHYLPGLALREELRATDDFEQATHHAELLIIGVPTSGVRSTAAAAREYIRPWIPVVSLSKGFEKVTLARMTQVIHEELPDHPVAALTGPNIAREILAGQAAASVIATEDLAVARAIQNVLRTGLFRVYTNNDVVGSELGGALKNVVAIACGIAQGLGVGDNTRSMVMTRGLGELTRLGVEMGGKALTFAGLAGMGDLVVTCLSPNSRNRSVGEKLGQGHSLEEITSKMSMVAEGLTTAITAHELAERHGVEMPVHEEMYKLITGQVPVTQTYRGLLTRPGHEWEPG